MKKKLLSIVLMLALATSLVVGVTVVSGAEDADGYLGTSALLAENITMQVKFDLDNCTNATVKVGDKAPASATSKLVDGKVVVLAEIPVKDINKALTVTATDGVSTYTKSTLADGVTPFTAKAYLEDLGETIYADLADALISYGNVAEKYFAKDNTLAPATTPTIPATYATSGTLPAGVEHYSAALVLETETTIRHYFEGDVSALTFKVGETVLTPAEKNGMSYVDIEGITPKELNDAYTLTVTDGATTYTCTYSALDYAARAFTAGGTDGRKALAEALYGYSVAAESVQGNISYMLNGGNALADPAVTFKPGEAIELPEAQNNDTSLDFIGWFFDSACSELATPEKVANSQTDVTLYAKYAPVFDKRVGFDKKELSFGKWGVDGAEKAYLNRFIAENGNQMTITYIPEYEEGSVVDGTFRFVPGTGAPNGRTDAMNYLLKITNGDIKAYINNNEGPVIANAETVKRIDIVFTFDTSTADAFVGGDLYWKYYVDGVYTGISTQNIIPAASDILPANADVVDGLIAADDPLNNYIYDTYADGGKQRNTVWQVNPGTFNNAKHTVAIYGGDIYGAQEAAAPTAMETNSGWYNNEAKLDYGTWLTENDDSVTIRFDGKDQRNDWSLVDNSWTGADNLQLMSNGKTATHLLFIRGNDIYMNEPYTGGVSGTNNNKTPIAKYDEDVVDMVVKFDFTAGKIYTAYYVNGAYVGNWDQELPSGANTASAYNYKESQNWKSLWRYYIDGAVSNDQKNMTAFDLTVFEGNIYSAQYLEYKVAIVE